MPRRDFSHFDDPDAVLIDQIIFGERACPECGRVLAACTSYFAPVNQPRSGWLTYACRICRAKRDNARYRRNRAKAAL